ncbi:MAG TPA: BamA/TamA family outer membrane protein [Bryobacteraceae bacterium]|nr:BamA/TamA family outer membrane protein [Bryobacteraceae bacterium]
MLCASAAGYAEDADRSMIVNSRAAQIEAQREEKARLLQPERPDSIENFLNFMKQRRVVERITAGVAGFRVRLGGLITGSGFALGPEYYRRTASESVVFRTSARGSFKKYYLLDAGVAFPRLARDRVFVDFYARRRHYPHLEYYGPGPDSRETGRTTYRFDDLSFDARAGVRPLEHLSLGVIGSYALPNVGPGTDERFAVTENVYGEDQAPGIRRQSDYLATGGFVQYDTRDNPGGPRRGGNYFAQYMLWSDREFHIGSFNRLELEAERYIPFLHDRRVIALRARTVFTDPRSGQFVPFYMQPTLGGSEDMRGYRPFRFHDNNSLVMNAEYRWEVFSGLDMALFADAGQVFHKTRDIGKGTLRKSFGFGFRFNVRNDVFFRIDTGFSREGAQIWFKFDNVF